MGRARVVAGAVSVLLAIPLVAGAQGLGAASNKEKARRERAKTPKAKTYTQEELAKLPPVANEDSSGSTAAPAAGAGATGGGQSLRKDSPRDAEADAKLGSESFWRGRLMRAQARIDKARQAHETVSRMYLVPGYEYSDGRGRVISTPEELQRMTAAAKAELDAAEKALADLLEEARRVGVPPGWLR